MSQTTAPADLGPDRQRLIERLLAQKGISVASPQRIARRATSGPCALSFAQERLWFLDQLEPGSPSYNLFSAARLEGELDPGVLRRSLDEIVRRHEILRTTFVSEAGRPLQTVHEPRPLGLAERDLSHLPEAAREAEWRSLAHAEARTPFDLARGPLLRVALVRTAPAEHLLLLTMHHIVSDGWSMNVLLKEVAALYDAFRRGRPSPLPELPIQYADFALWQRGWLAGAELQSRLDYWKARLAGAPPVLELPADRPRPAVMSYRGAALNFKIPHDLAAALRELSHREGVTLFILMLAAFKTLLSRYARQEDVVVGVDVANRGRVEVEPLVGFFINMLVMRSSLAGDPTFRELLGRVREAAIGAYAHQDVPFEKLVEELKPERSLNVSPLFQVVFNFQTAPEQELGLDGLRLSFVQPEAESARFDLSLFVFERRGELHGAWRYSTDLFDAARVERMARHFENLLRSVTRQPDARLSALEILGEEERRRQAETRDVRKASNFQKFKSTAPKARSLAQSELVRTSPLGHGSPLPLVVEPNVADLDLRLWAASNRALVDELLLKHGAILFRDFGVREAELGRVTEAVSGGLLPYDEPSSPRTEVNPNVYTSTDYPATQSIPLHNELSYSLRWPAKVCFLCVTAPRSGGETPVAYSREVLALIDPALREEFTRRGVMYVRNYGEGLGLPWRHVFRTDERAEVEEYCRRAGIEAEWKGDDRLRTRQVRPAVLSHPRTGEALWFNQAHAFHVSGLEPAVRRSLQSLFADDEMPNNAFFGDGSPIADAAVEEINRAYRRAEVAFPWREGDLLLVENMLAAHGRRPFEGPRKILVAMAEPTGRPTTQ
jgi:alpha-ketoglutarate-dependent taurine dioxygenase